MFQTKQIVIFTGVESIQQTKLSQ